MRREERQSCHDKDYGKSHYGKGERIGFQRTGTFGNKSLLRQQTCNGNLPYNRKKTAQNKYPTAGIVPEISIVAQAFETGAVVGSARSKFIELLAQPVKTGIVQPAALTLYKLRMVRKEITRQSRAYQYHKRMKQRGLPLSFRETPVYVPPSVR